MSAAAEDRTAPRAPLGFQPGLAVSDPLARHWLRQATLRLRREVAWLWHQRGEAGQGGLPGFADPLSDALDLMRYEDERRRFFHEDATAGYLSGLLAQPPAPGPTPAGGFGWLVAELGLGPADCLALALALGRVLDSAQAPVIAACLNDPAATRPNLALMQRLWDRPEEVLALLDPGHPLAAHAVFDPAPAGWQSPLEVAPAVAHRLLYPEAGLPAAFRPVAPLAGDGADAEETALAVARLRTRAPGRLCIVPVVGPEGAPRAARAAAMAAELGLPLAEIAGAPPGEAGLDALLVAAWLGGTAVFLPFGALAGREGGAGWLARLARVPAVVFAGLDEGDRVAELPPRLTQPRVRLAALPYEGRLACWRAELPAVWAGEAGRQVLTECARRFRYEAGTIARIAGAVRALEHAPAPHDVFAACRADLDLGELAQPVVPRFTLDELMLPERQAAQIRQLVTAAGTLTRVHHDWGTARAWNEAGLSVLFSGAPGTGKTMAAEAIARAVDMPIFRIDLSQVVNKYIGETEKNLRRLFDAADAADVILFFDEADALFGKRTEVKDAHDRYANLEVSYLLERMERFKGMAVLASNRRKDLDEAFMRRLRYVVQFPLPGPEERLRIWRAVLPAGVDSSGLDLEFLAERIPLSGGHIRSAVFNACLQSAAAEGPARLTMAAVVQAVKDEFDKLNRAVSRDQFGRYAEHLGE